MIDQMVTWTGMLAQDSGAGAAGGVIGGLLGIVVCVIAIALFVFWIWMLIDCIQRDFEGNGKVIWILVIVLLSWLGALIYFFVGRGKGTKGGAPTPQE